MVGIVYIPCITQAAVRCHRTLQRQLLVVTGHGVGSLLGHVYTVDGAILPDNVLTGIDQVHGHRRRCLTSGLHGAIDQEHARQTGNKVVGGSDIIVQEGSAAVNADGIDVAETTKVFGFCISYGVAVRIGTASLQRTDGGLQLVVIALISLTESHAVGRGNQQNAADGRVDDIGQPKPLKIGKGCIAGVKVCIGIYQQVGIHAAGRPAAIEVGTAVDIDRILGNAIQHGEADKGFGLVELQVLHRGRGGNPGLFQQLEGSFVSLRTRVVERQCAAGRARQCRCQNE